MGVSKEQAAENRRAIVEAATQLFRERGVDAVGLSELMKQAGFTQGGFYNHFRSKDALVAEVFALAMAKGSAEIAQSSKVPADEATSTLQRFLDYYLSRAHRDDIDHGCPVAGFANEVSRIGGEAQSHFAGGLDNAITLIAGMIANGGLSDATNGRRTLREQAISLYCELVGALILSRSVIDTAPALGNEILESSRRGLSEFPGLPFAGKRE